MAEYIEREAAIEAVTMWYKKACRPENMSSYNMGERAAYTTAISEIAKLHAADVRPVVLCRDCKWYQIDELKKDGTEDKRYKPSVCVLAEQRREPNHFCADGERRKADGT